VIAVANALLRLAATVAQAGRRALDFAGEEAAARVRLRADRLDLSAALRSCRRDECPG